MEVGLLKSSQPAAITQKPAKPCIPPGARYSSLTEMLSLANLQSVPVVGDGNCGFYAYLASQGKLEHSQRANIGMPSIADYNAQPAATARKVCSLAAK